MRTAHKKPPVMRRTSRLFCNDMNAGNVVVVCAFLHQYRDVTQYFVDLFWQRQDFSADLADLATIHRERDRFGITTRLAQAWAKQAKEICATASSRYWKPWQVYEVECCTMPVLRSCNWPSKCNIWSMGRITLREELRQFWSHTKEHLRTGRLLKIQVHKMAQNLWRELKLHTGFAVSFAFNLLPGPADKQIMVE